MSIDGLFNEKFASKIFRRRFLYLISFVLHSILCNFSIFVDEEVTSSRHKKRNGFLLFCSRFYVTFPSL